jgi:hypothetical protein
VKGGTFPQEYAKADEKTECQAVRRGRVKVQPSQVRMQIEEERRGTPGLSQ